MADLEHFYNAKGEICNLIEVRIRKLFEMTTSEYNYPPWIQATMLFYEIVLPCDCMPTKGLIEIAENLIKESEKHDHKAYFYVENGGKKELCYIEDVTKKVEKIKVWFEQSKKYIENFD